MAQLIGNRKELSEEHLERMEEVVMDAAKAQAILEASRSSMGQQKYIFSFNLLSYHFDLYAIHLWLHHAPYLPTLDQYLSLVITQGGRVALS